MTLLITIVTPNFSLLTSDLRISVQQGGRFVPVDEKFNKHIVFHSKGLTADIAYTGQAQWTVNGKTITLYDVISDSVSKSAQSSLNFGPLSYQLLQDLSSALKQPPLLFERGTVEFELHIIGRHEQIPFPLISVMSTFRTNPPWPLIEGEFYKEFTFPGINMFIKFAEHPSVILGGMDQLITAEERRKLIATVNGGGDAYNMSRISSKYVEAVSRRTTSVGPTSVSVVMPREGFLDTSLWDKSATGIRAFLPRMVFPNGTMFGPCEFPVELKLITDGHLPLQSLFFKSVVTALYKKSARRRIFKHKGGKAIPGIMGLLMLVLFGTIPEGYTDFGLGGDTA